MTLLKNKANKYFRLMIINGIIMSSQKTRIEFIRCVDCKAEELDRQGYAVKADIGGWSKPPTIMNMVPDLRPKRGDKIILGKFVRPEETGKIEEEYRKFIEYVTNKETHPRSIETPTPFLHLNDNLI